LQAIKEQQIDIEPATHHIIQSNYSRMESFSLWYHSHKLSSTWPFLPISPLFIFKEKLSIMLKFESLKFLYRVSFLA